MKKTNRLVSAFHHIWSFFGFTPSETSKHALALNDRHEMLLKDLSDVLEFDDTSINIDLLAKKYYVENSALHITYCIVGNSSVIMMVNSHDNVEKKFDVDVINDAIDLILLEKNKRMERTFLRMEQRADIMIDRIGSIIRKEKESRIAKQL